MALQVDGNNCRIRTYILAGATFEGFPVGIAYLVDSPGLGYLFGCMPGGGFGWEGGPSYSGDRPAIGWFGPGERFLTPGEYLPLLS